jgi:hypothetical protein
MPPTHDSIRQTNVKENVETLTPVCATTETISLPYLFNGRTSFPLEELRRRHDLAHRQCTEVFNKSERLSPRPEKCPVPVEFETENVIL